ncbi:hypothetical protein CON65_15045 [Bacillus pseudomycoides]|uniref:DUF1517 domain-containing protein n=1 Tax=Bacillus pseudomycoides TaxID=64104 RepID=A0AA91VBW4_9BACI|nr:MULTISPECIES: hypothetical protein [Bacillus]PEB53016.1 hypothetical protein COO03_10170 [Bacillus sp. AFS098217]PED81798.1 hypothetical protein CON65_15045 [Bacillus pseudomycoides]PEU15226.1 hypothetical protein CN525_17550 [Bacillus sp. AFS014408]PEU17828.1 hypothetical protein CN524_00815 [Bacillus sp. AFS019443]PFW58790.1 hypothetical protein COL20_25000 [Bacillus sp. AFS075034]
MNMSKKIFTLMLAFTLFALPTFAQAKTYSGGKSSVSSHSSSGGFSTKGSTSGSHRSSDGTYHSGYKSSSSNVQSKKPASVDRTPQSQPAPKKSSFWGHAASFGAGALLGSMLHPFGNHGVGGVGGSFFSSGLLIDIVILLGIVWVLRRIFVRR